MGWSPQWQLREGIVNAYEWFVDNTSSVRMV